MTPRIGIDLRMLAQPLDGTSRYALELARGMPRAFPGADYVLVGDRERVRRHLPQAAVAHARSRPVTVREQFELPGLLDRARLDLFHATIHAGPLADDHPLVITIHDVIFSDLPELYGRGRKLYLETVARALALRARAVLTVSEFSRRQLERHLGIPAERIEVTPNGIDPRFAPVEPDAIERYREGLSLPPDYLLYVGGFLPHKNVPVLLRAYARLADSPPLVLCGGGFEAVQPEIARLGLVDRVLLIPGQDDRGLPALYSGATAFVFPSRYEGFGLPPLEAMACGCPTIVADAGSLPEVTGSAALLFPPDDCAALAERIDGLLGSAERRAALGAAARAQAARFRWEECVTRTAAAYRRALDVRT